ncbi:putative transporter [Serratia liquefaciens]|nr:putative transporter [Serratia liquefaciens]
MLSNVKKKDVPLIAISLAAIVFIAATLSLFPQQTAQAADSIFNGVTRLLGSTVQVLVLLALGLVLYLATSKYGNIRLGEGKVEYSTLSWLFMFICAGLGSSTLYWGVANGLITTRPRALTLPRNRRKRWNTASLTLSSTAA